MKRSFNKKSNQKMIWLIIGCFLFLLLPCKLISQDVSVTRVSDDVIVLHPRDVRNLSIVREVGGTVTAVRTDRGIVVIDSFGSFEAAEAARKLIKDRFPNSSFKFLICTHHHPDHVRGNQFFKDVCIIGHKNVERYITEDHNQLFKKYGCYEGKIDSLENLLKMRDQKYGDENKKIKEDLEFWKGTKNFLEAYVPTPPTLQISTSTILKLGGKTFEILFFGPAHTDNDLVVLDRKDRLLIMGDLFCYRKCYLMSSQSDAINWISLLDKLIDRRDEFDFVIPGHGGIVENVDALIEQRDYLKNICAAVNLAKQTNMTLDQAKDSILLEKDKDYMMYDRLELDIEAYWLQLERTEKLK